MLTHEHSGRLWLETGRQPHTRRDGTTTELIVWACQCAAPGCTELVEVKTPADGYERSKAFGAKHCAEHKLTRAEATERWQEAIRRNREHR